AWAGREPVERDRQVLRRCAQIRGGQQPHRLLQQFDGAPLAGTAMTLLMASGALGDQRVGVLLPAPAAEALGPERAGVLPQARIVAGAVQVQDHPVIRAEMMPAPVERLAD